jgi:orotidine-5'-phosphate decarboxylase
MAELILALDLPDRNAVLGLLDRLPEVRWVKVGSRLMTGEGPSLVRELVGRGHAVFLDLKWHDIPNTVHNAVTAARNLGARMATVHTLGGSEMMAAAREAAGDALALAGVTVLTSHTPASWATVTGRPVADLGAEAVRLARAARAAGLDGVVCSPAEVAPVRAALGAGGLIVVPGIRRGGEPPDDQRRTATAGEAVRAGATHLVVGRPVFRAPDPAAAWAALEGELA